MPFSLFRIAFRLGIVFLSTVPAAQVERRVVQACETSSHDHQTQGFCRQAPFLNNNGSEKVPSGSTCQHFFFFLHSYFAYTNKAPYVQPKRTTLFALKYETQDAALRASKFLSVVLEHASHKKSVKVFECWIRLTAQANKKTTV
jgi:hypothetical protein